MPLAQSPSLSFSLPRVWLGTYIPSPRSIRSLARARATLLTHFTCVYARACTEIHTCWHEACVYVEGRRCWRILQIVLVGILCMCVYISSMCACMMRVSESRLRFSTPRDYNFKFLFFWKGYWKFLIFFCRWLCKNVLFYFGNIFSTILLYCYNTWKRMTNKISIHYLIATL